MVTPEDITEFEFKLKSAPKPEFINEQLKDHQISSQWDKHNLIHELHIWVERFVDEFKLQIEGVPALMVDKINRFRFGHFRPGRNGFGLQSEIAINETYLKEHENWRLLGTLLHELLHAEQEQSGKPGQNNYHNKEYRERAKSFGLIVDTWGHMIYAPAPTPFWDIIEKYGNEIPDTLDPIEEQATEPGDSKLKLWICECKPNPVRVRVGIKDFRAKCLRCDTIFHLRK